MSTQAVAWALDARQSGRISPTARLVLAVMADYADPTGRNVWVTNETIAARIGLGTRVVQRGRRELEDASLIFLGDQNVNRHLRGGYRPPVYDLAVNGVQLVIEATGEVVEIGEEPYLEDPTTRIEQCTNPSEAGVSDLSPLPGSRGVGSVIPAGSRGVGSDAGGVSDPTPKPRTEPTTPNSPLPEGDRSAREEPVVDIPMLPQSLKPERVLHAVDPDACGRCGRRIGKSHTCHAPAPPAPPPAAGFAAVVASPAPPRSGQCAVCGAAGTIADRGRGLCFRCLAADVNGAPLQLGKRPGQVRA